jgi:hypothetical protein
MSLASQRKIAVRWFEKELAYLLTIAPDVERQLDRSTVLRGLRRWATEAKRRSAQYGFVHSRDRDCAKAVGLQLAWKATWVQDNRVIPDTAFGELLLEWTHPPLFRGFLDYVQEGYRAYITTELQKPGEDPDAKIEEVALEYASKLSVRVMTDETEQSVDGTKSLAETKSLASIASWQTLPAAEFLSLILATEETRRD